MYLFRFSDASSRSHLLHLEGVFNSSRRELRSSILILSSTLILLIFNCSKMLLSYSTFLYIGIILQGDLVWTIRGISRRRFYLQRCSRKQGVNVFLSILTAPLLEIKYSTEILDVFYIQISFIINIFIYVLKWINVLSSLISSHVSWHPLKRSFRRSCDWLPPPPPHVSQHPPSVLHMESRRGRY